MDDRLKELMQALYSHIMGEQAIREMTGQPQMTKKEKESYQRMLMQAAHISDYLEEEHTKLTDELEQPIAFTADGEALVTVTSNGLEYYMANKEDILESFILKVGCDTVHLEVPELDKYFYHNRDIFMENVGQAPMFGSKSQEEVAVEETYIPFIDVLEDFPNHLMEQPISEHTCAAIISLILDDAKATTFYKISNKFHADDYQ